MIHIQWEKGLSFLNNPRLLPMCSKNNLYSEISFVTVTDSMTTRF